MSMRKLISIVETEQLDELSGVKHVNDKDFTGRNQVLMFLQSKGYKILGYGEYGAVCDHPSFKGRYVLKVFADKNYEAYIEYCRANPQNRHLPKFVGRTMRISPQACMVRVEKLTPVSDDFYYQALGQLVNQAYRYTHPDSTDEVRARVLDWVEDMDVTDLFNTLVDLDQKAPPGAQMDLHPGNFMRRDRTVVVSDPYKGAKLPFAKKPPETQAFVPTEEPAKAKNSAQRRRDDELLAAIFDDPDF